MKQYAVAEASGSSPCQAAMAATVPFPLALSPSVVKKCDFCGRNGHFQPQCFAYIAAKKDTCSGNSKPQQASHVSKFVGTAAIHPLPPSTSSNHPPLTA
jgi:hypothetical protein